MKKIRPILDHVLILLDAEDTVTAGGIIIPDSARKKPHKGEVLAVGSGVTVDTIHETPRYKLHAPEVQPGQRVLVSAYSGVPVPDDDRQILVHEREILGIIEG